MTDVMIGGKDYSVTPMNLHEAFEVMFVLSPYVLSFHGKEDILGKLDSFIDAIKEKDPFDIFRLLAYMLHVDAEELINEEVQGHEVAMALVTGFQVNSLPNLIDIAYALRIADTGWDDAYLS
jgi:hypothetical protein